MPEVVHVNKCIFANALVEHWTREISQFSLFRAHHRLTGSYYLGNNSERANHI